jgi:tetratricopeptide (TPR) repeat protein
MIKLLIVHLFLLFPVLLSAQEVDLLILNNEYDKALKLIDEKLSADEAQPALHLKKGIILQKQFDYAGAMKSLQKAYRLDSLNPGILNEIADLN